MRIFEVTDKSVIQTIKKDCKPYLHSVYDPLMLYRGEPYDQGFAKKAVRKAGRTPVAMDPAIHAALNEYFVKRFGHPYRNGVFCVANPNIASGFGQTYHVFPIGEYEAIWSPKIADLNYFLDDDEFDIWKYDLEDAEPGTEEYDGLVERLWDVLDQSKYIQGQLDDAWAFKNEIMIWCDHYYILPVSYITDKYPGLSNKEATDEFRKFFTT